MKRISRKGDGLALIYGKSVIVTKVDYKQHRSFESANWRTTIGNKTLNILSLYHSPYSVSQKITNTIFIDDLTDYLIKWMGYDRDIIICGNFNMHIDDLTDIEPQILNDTTEALGLQQHVNFETHHDGNILDLLFTEIASQLTMKTFKGKYISDHRAIVTEFDARVQHTQSRSVTFTNLKQINVSEFQSSLDFSNIDNMDDLQSVYDKYQNELTRVLN